MTIIALYFFEFLICGLGGIFLLTQILIPLILRRPLFPLFRPRATAEEALILAQDDLAAAKTARKVISIQEKTSQLYDQIPEDHPK